MREIILKIKDGEVRIFAEGVKGQGTAEFTEGLAKELGKIEERHKGHDHVHHHHHHHDASQVKQGNSRS